MLPLVGSFASRLMCAVNVANRPLNFVPCCAPVNATLLVSGTTFHSPANATALQASPAAATKNWRRRVRFMVLSGLRPKRTMTALYRPASRARSATSEPGYFQPAAGAMLESRATERPEARDAHDQRAAHRGGMCARGSGGVL